MPTFVGILTLTSIKNTPSKILKQNMSLYIQNFKATENEFNYDYKC